MQQIWTFIQQSGPNHLGLWHSPQPPGSAPAPAPAPAPCMCFHRLRSATQRLSLRSRRRSKASTPRLPRHWRPTSRRRRGRHCASRRTWSSLNRPASAGSGPRQPATAHQILRAEEKCIGGVLEHKKAACLSFRSYLRKERQAVFERKGTASRHKKEACPPFPCGLTRACV